MTRGKPVGWVKEPVRHGLSAKGIPTVVPKPPWTKWEAKDWEHHLASLAGWPEEAESLDLEENENQREYFAHILEEGGNKTHAEILRRGWFRWGVDIMPPDGDVRDVSDFNYGKRGIDFTVLEVAIEDYLRTAPRSRKHAMVTLHDIVFDAMHESIRDAIKEDM